MQSTSSTMPEGVEYKIIHPKCEVCKKTSSQINYLDSKGWKCKTCHDEEFFSKH